MEENRKLKIIVGVLALVLVLGGGCLCLSLGWLVDFASEDMDNEIANTREGAEFGATRTTEECLREGYVRSSRCSDIEALCITSAKDFMDACLHAVAEPDLSVCEGAPAAPGFLPNQEYVQRVGARFGWEPESDGACGDVAAELETYCAVSR